MPFSLMFSYFGLWISWNAAVYVSSPSWDIVWSVLTIVLAFTLMAWGFVLDGTRVVFWRRPPSAVRGRFASISTAALRRDQDRKATRE